MREILPRGVIKVAELIVKPRSATTHMTDIDSTAYWNPAEYDCHSQLKGHAQVYNHKKSVILF